MPITVFVFVIPLMTRRIAAKIALRTLLATSLGLIALGLFLMEAVSVRSHWTVLLPGFIVAGIGIGLANPTIAGAALRVVDPSRTGMASGISNTSRVGGLAIGVAVLGASLQQRVGDRLATAGHSGKALAAAVSSAGIPAVSSQPRLIPIAHAAFVSGFRLILAVCIGTLVVGALSAALLIRTRSQPPAAAPSPAS